MKECALMSIEEIVKNYNAEKSQKIFEDYHRLYNKITKKKTFQGTEETEPPWWSGDVGKEVAEKDFLCTNALLAMAVLNDPTNVEDFFSAIKQIKTRFKDKKPDGYDPKIAQHPFSFFRGTVLHEYLNPNSEKCVDKEWAKRIIKNDVCLFDTKFGKLLRKILNFDEIYQEQFKTNIREITSTEKLPVFVYARKFRSKNSFGDLTARALTRTSKYGAYALTGLGALHAAHEIADGENVIKTLGQTTAEIGTTLIGTGYLGAIGYKHYGPLGSLIGIGIGSLIGSEIPELFFKHRTKSL